MAMHIKIRFEQGELAARLDDSPTSATIYQALPFEAAANRWGEEIYFTMPVLVEEAPDARQDMEVGELGYWPVGSAFCIFFGPTPASTGANPRAYSNVNPFGRIEAGEGTIRRLLATVKDGEMVRVAPA
jgi:hypothetical protein